MRRIKTSGTATRHRTRRRVVVPLDATIEFDHETSTSGYELPAM
jgi:hypothetical protein